MGSSDGTSALGFSQTPEANYDSILRAQSSLNRQASSMMRSQMSQITRAETQAVKAQKEARERVEELQSEAIITYNVPKHADVIGDIAYDIGVQDTKQLMARAQQGLYPTQEQAAMVAAHDSAIKSFANDIGQEFAVMQKRGYYDMPTFKQRYGNHLKALHNGEVEGYEPVSIADRNAPTPFAYMYGSGELFRPLGDTQFSEFILEPQYWSYWFDKNAQEQKQTVRRGEQQGAQYSTESVGATTTQFSVFDPEIGKVRPKSANEIINEGILDSWFKNDENYEGSMLLRQGAIGLIAQEKAREFQGYGSGFITVGDDKIKISDIDPADNGNPLAFTYLMAQVLSDRVADYGMDNTTLSISDTERISFSIINRDESEAEKEAAYRNKFGQLANVYTNNGGIINKNATELINGVAMKNISEVFPALKYQGNSASVFFDPTNKEFVLRYSEKVRGRSVTRTSSALSLNEFAEAAQLFPGYSWPTASKVLARMKAFSDGTIDVASISGDDPQDVQGLDEVYRQVSAEWTAAAAKDSLKEVQREIKTVIRNNNGAIPTSVGNVMGISILSESDQTFEVIFMVDGKRRRETYTLSQLRELAKRIGVDSSPQNSIAYNDKNLPLDLEQLKFLNRIG